MGKYIIQANGSVLLRCGLCGRPCDPLTVRRLRITSSGGMSMVDKRRVSTRDLRSKSLSRIGVVEQRRVFFTRTITIQEACLDCQNLGEAR